MRIMRRKSILDEERERVDVIKVRRKIKLLSLQFIYVLKVEEKLYPMRLKFTSFRKNNLWPKYIQCNDDSCYILPFHFLF